MPRLKLDGERLSGQQIEKLQELLIDAFDQNSLERMLATKLKKRLDRLSSLNQDFETIVFDVIEGAEQGSWTAELLQGARSVRQSHIGLLKFAKQIELEPSTDGLERIIRANNPELEPEPWFLLGAERMGQVCRVEIPSINERGTGFLIGPDLVLTCYHVVKRIVEANVSSSFIHLRFDQRVKPNNDLTSQFSALHDSEWLVDYAPFSESFDKVPNGALDYAVLRTAKPVGKDIVDTQTGKTRGWIRISPFPYEFKMDTPLVLLGHPRGDSLKLTLDTSSIIAVNDDSTRVRHRTNTEPGSSGSPCCDLLNWQVVALHHLGDPSTPSHYNQGIPISAIRQNWVWKLANEELTEWQHRSLTSLVQQNF